MSAIALRITITLAALFGPAPAALAAANSCGGRGLEIVQKAYPGAKTLPDNAFRAEGKTLSVPDEGSMGGDPHAMLCRIWPAWPELMLVAVPLVDNPRQQDGNEGDLDMLVLDRQSLDVKGRYRVEGLMSDDAIFITELAFDTAFYQLAPGNVAFGLRKATRGSSSPNPYNDTTLWLFAIEGQQLKPVLENLVVAKFGGEWDMNCNGEFDSVNRTLTMAPAKSPMADIIVSDTLVHRLSEGTAEVCKDTEKTTTAKHRLRFKDGSYEVPKALSGF